MKRKILAGAVVLMFVVGLVMPLTAISKDVKIVDGIRIVEITTNDPNWKGNFRENIKGPYNAIFMVHGVEWKPTKVTEYFDEKFAVKVAKERGYDTVVLFEYIPEGKRYFGRPSISVKAGYDLVQANAISKSVTGKDPGFLGHSQATVIGNKGAVFQQGGHFLLSSLRSTDEMEKARWGEVIFTGSTIDAYTNLENLEASVSGRITTSAGEKPAIFNIISPNDIATGTFQYTEKGVVGLIDLGEERNIILKQKYFNPIKEHSRYNEPESVEEIYKNLPKVYTPKSEDIFSPETSFPSATPSSWVTSSPPWGNGDDGPDGGDFGGVDFTDIHLCSIYSNTSISHDGQFSAFSYALKAQKAEEGDKIIEVEKSTELSLNSFFIGLTLPESEFWVNLNPWEPDRIIEKDLEETDIGRIMLEADLQMKKDFCKYKNPCESEIGEEYWRLLDEKGEELIKECMNNHPGEIEDINNVQFAPVTRHWIVPDRVEAYETDNEIYIVNATLNIYSEPVYEHSTYEIVNQDAFFVSRACKDDLNEAAEEYGRYAKELEEEMILPLVVQEVNHGENYSDLRSVYNSLALAQWYKDKYRYIPSIFTDFIDSKDLTGLESKSEWNAENIWRDYVKSFEKGEFHCWKNETYQEGDYIITSTKHYSSGGVDFGDIETSIVGDMPSDLRDLTSEAVYSIFAKEGNDYYFGDGLYVFYEGLEKAGFKIGKLIISPAMVKVGKPVTIKVEVKNAGGMEDTKTINIEINGKIVGSKEVTLAPGEIMTLEFTQIQSAEGDHSVTVGGLTGNYEVVTTTPGFEVISAIIGLLSVVYLINRKKKKRQK